MQETVETRSAPNKQRGRRLLSYDDLRARGIPFSKIHLWRLAREGKFPAPVKLSHSRNAWVEEEVEHWLEQMVASRDGAEVGHGS